MKKVLLTLASVLVGLSAYAQGTVAFQNRDTANNISAPIYDVSVGGTKLVGTAYLAQLYFGAVGAAESAFQAVSIAPVSFRGTLPTDATAGYVNVGADTSRSLSGIPFNTPVQVQIRAWSAAGGATYEAALAAAQANSAIHIGKSTPITITTAASALNTPSPMVGLASFALTSQAGPIIPEPTTIALGLLGAALLFIRRRQ